MTVFLFFGKDIKELEIDPDGFSLGSLFKIIKELKKKFKKRNRLKDWKGALDDLHDSKHVSRIMFYPSLEIRTQFQCIAGLKSTHIADVIETELDMDDPFDATHLPVIVDHPFRGGLGISAFTEDLEVNDAFFDELKRKLEAKIRKFQEKRRKEVENTVMNRVKGEVLKAVKDNDGKGCCSNPNIIELKDASREGFGWGKW